MVVKVYNTHDNQASHCSTRIQPRAPLQLDPATAVLHYAQEIFEGLKAYRTPEGGAALFRAEMNARRFRDSAERLAMAPLPEELFLQSVRELVRIDRDWIPDSEGGSLYLRPFMIASEVFLGVRPAHEYLYMVIASPAGAYFKGGTPAVSIWISNCAFNCSLLSRSDSSTDFITWMTSSRLSRCATTAGSRSR